MLVLDRSAGHLQLPFSFDFCASPRAAMDLPPGEPPTVMSLFSPASADEPADDHFANPFPPSDAPDDSLFFLFPSGVSSHIAHTSAPDAASVEHAMAGQHVSSGMIAPANYISRPVKREPEFAAMRDELAMSLPSTVPLVNADLPEPPQPAHSLKRKRADVLLPEPLTDHDVKPDLTDFLPTADAYAYASPSKRIRTSAATGSSFASELDSYDALTVHASPETEPKSSPHDTPLIGKPTAKPRSPSSRRRKKTAERAGSSSGGSDSDSSSGTGPRKTRTLNQMKSLARSHAPEVSLTQDELKEIAAMHESDDDLAQSAELYRELVGFKRALARCGYRLGSITLDPLTQEDDVDRDEPFDLVLKRRNKPTAFASGAPVTDILSAGARETTPPKDSTSMSTPPTYSRKRVKAAASGDNASDSPGMSCTVCAKVRSLASFQSMSCYIHLLTLFLLADNVRL